MNAETFVDTNVLLYTIDEDAASSRKRERARQLLLSERWGWSVQVAAKQLGCHTVYSEDLNHGQDYDGVRVVNPFLTAVPEGIPPATGD